MNLAKKKFTLSGDVFLFLQNPNPLSLAATNGVSVDFPSLASQMFQFAKFEKSKERRLATELGDGFPIGDPWITDDELLNPVVFDVRMIRFKETRTYSSQPILGI
uniref:Uncharacterized protein n=1 Tax=Salix viminalis TaxID=40686 RepID=A0A6N2NEV7_SALVM